MSVWIYLWWFMIIYDDDLYQNLEVFLLRGI